MMTITTQMDAQAQAESHYIIIPLGEVDEFWGSWLALGGRKSMSAEISAHIHPCGPSIRPAQNCARLPEPSDFSPRHPKRLEG